jgi:hypothetical protein
MAPTGNMTDIAPGHGGVQRDPRTLANHSSSGATLALLRRCLSLRLTVDAGGVEVVVTANNVGHRVPTGFPGRSLELLVENFDQARQIWTAAASKIYAKQFLDGRSGLATDYWREHDNSADTRLLPEQPNRVRLPSAKGGVRLRARLVYRSFGVSDSQALDVVTTYWP